MCSPTDESKIRAEAGQWMQRGKMFTSVDIANSLKQRGDWVRNRDVADYLRAKVVNISPQYGFRYKTTIINVTLPNGSNAEATLYHPEGTNATAYTKTNQKAMSPDEAKDDGPPKIPMADEDPEDGEPGPYIKGVATRLEPKPNQVINVSIQSLVVEHMTVIMSPGDINLDEDFTEEYEEED